MSYTVLIADDEPYARDYLAELVKQHQDLELLNSCKSGNELLKYCQTLVPNIILLDIQMPGLNGIETARQLLKLNNESIVVFTTAFDKYAIEAFAVEAVGYLLKPFTVDQFTKTIDKAIHESEKHSRIKFQERIERLYKAMQTRTQMQSLTHLEIKKNGLIHQLATDNIHYIEAASEYAKLMVLDNYFLYRISLDLIDKQLAPHFLRVHRSYIINLKKLVNWKYLNNNTYQFSFSNGDRIVSSKSYKEKIQVALSNFN